MRPDNALVCLSVLFMITQERLKIEAKLLLSACLASSPNMDRLALKMKHTD